MEWSDMGGCDDEQRSSRARARAKSRVSLDNRNSRAIQSLIKFMAFCFVTFLMLVFRQILAVARLQNLSCKQAKIHLASNTTLHFPGTAVS